MCHHRPVVYFPSFFLPLTLCALMLVSLLSPCLFLKYYISKFGGIHGWKPQYAGPTLFSSVTCLGDPYMLLAIAHWAVTLSHVEGASVCLTYEPQSLMTKSSLWDFLGLWEVRLTAFASIKARTTHSANLGKIPSRRVPVWILVSLLLLYHHKIKILMPS